MVKRKVTDYADAHPLGLNNLLENADSHSQPLKGHLKLTDLRHR
jgi:hypothetical protein